MRARKFNATMQDCRRCAIITITRDDGRRQYGAGRQPRLLFPCAVLLPVPQGEGDMLDARTFSAFRIIGSGVRYYYRQTSRMSMARHAAFSPDILTSAKKL